MFWKDNYKKIMNKLLKYNFKKGPLLVNVIWEGWNRYYKLSIEEAKLIKDIKSEVFLLLYNNWKEKWIVTCDNKVKKLLESYKVYICGN
jgi:hypothetical protein